jgi:hypothetical protein
VADVREERRLGPVDLRQRVGAPSLFFRGAGVGNGSCHLTGNQLEEPAILVIEAAP